MSEINPNCGGAHCRKDASPDEQIVKMYPLGGGANLILCMACWAAENRYRYERGKETGRPQDWPQQDYWKAKPYPEEWL